MITVGGVCLHYGLHTGASLQLTWRKESVSPGRYPAGCACHVDGQPNPLKAQMVETPRRGVSIALKCTAGRQLQLVG
jgi:hypothetical protein